MVIKFWCKSEVRQVVHIQGVKYNRNNVQFVATDVVLHMHRVHILFTFRISTSVICYRPYGCIETVEAKVLDGG